MADLVRRSVRAALCLPRGVVDWCPLNQADVKVRVPTWPPLTCWGQCVLMADLGVKVWALLGEPLLHSD